MMISILTPTYNRAYILPQLYKSLVNQTSKNFEWIIIDDGSLDETQNIINYWKIENKAFNIRYIKKINGGKHTALNMGVPFAKYDYIYIIDSDDYMMVDGVEKILNWLSQINSSKYFAGISGLRGKKIGNKIEILGQYPIKRDYIDATNLERKKYHLLGDKAEVYRKDLLLKYPFPVFENEKFLSESAVWDKIAGAGYKIRWFGEIVCICEYLEDGLTQNDGVLNKLNNFKGYTYNEKQNIKLKNFPYNLLAVGRYIEIANLQDLHFSEIQNNLDINQLMLYSGVVIGFCRKIYKKGLYFMTKLKRIFF